MLHLEKSSGNGWFIHGIDDETQVDFGSLAVSEEELIQLAKDIQKQICKKKE